MGFRTAVKFGLGFAKKGKKKTSGKKKPPSKKKTPVKKKTKKKTPTTTTKEPVFRPPVVKGLKERVRPDTVAKGKRVMAPDDAKKIRSKRRREKIRGVNKKAVVGGIAGAGAVAGGVALSRPKPIKRRKLNRFGGRVR